MKKSILGLDLGTNSIGWALVDYDFESTKGKIIGMGSRIIPMGQDTLGDFGKGNSVSQTHERTRLRMSRRIKERQLLRRARLLRTLKIMGCLPQHFIDSIDFEFRLGEFKQESKLAYNQNGFIFADSFQEMLADFKLHQPLTVGNGKKIPYDWTIYYLRKKAINYKITREELGWIILNFNQKRGYYQLRGEDDTDATRTAQTRTYFDTQIVEEIFDTGELYKGLRIFILKLANGDTGKYYAKEYPNWVGREKNIIATVDLDKEGNDKLEADGTLKRKFTIPTDSDWEEKWKLIKIKAEKEIRDSHHTVGSYIYDYLLKNPTGKIRGKLVRTIEREFYKNELKAILNKQMELQPELFSDQTLNECLEDLYRHNLAHQNELKRKGFEYLIIEDILFYQRPLRSQKSTISNCTLEFRIYKNDKGVEIKEFLKAIPKSHPLYQEFRIWQWLYNLKIYNKDDDTDITHQFIRGKEDFERLFAFLNEQKSIDQKGLLKFLLKESGLKPKELNSTILKYRWNYVYDETSNESKEYPCNETAYEIRKRLQKISHIPEGFLNDEVLGRLWHIIYSVTDKGQFEKALENFIIKYNHLNKSNVDILEFKTAFSGFPPYKNDYGSFSLKAIRKLLPLMRIGKYWDWEQIDVETKERIEKILTGEFDEAIRDRVREKAIALKDIKDFQGLQLWLAQYIVYNRHTEAASVEKWNTVHDMEQFLRSFKQHSLRNPIVEMVVTETLRVVKDIWVHFGNGKQGYFDEIHIELGREMKSTAEQRKNMTIQVTSNENTNMRIKALIAELKSDPHILNVRPYSPVQQEALKIYEEGVLNSMDELPEDIAKISKAAQPSKSELQRYKLWLEQKYRSPYTGEVIPLSALFTESYQIEHIIPQSRYFDDSFSNKVICEAIVNANPYKDNQLGLEFIKAQGGKVVDELSGNGKLVRIFTEEEYRKFVDENYGRNRLKRNKLLMDEIPEKMIERQLNDTRYISKYITGILSCLVRTDERDEGSNAKNVLPGNGKVTSILKQDWGLNDVWNDLILPRFKRMNKITGTDHFVSKNMSGHEIPVMPLVLSKGFTKKRIDHRHHALDALVIACATRDHINYLSNLNANVKGVNEKGQLRYDLKHKLCFTTSPDDKGNYKWLFKKPWFTFTEETKERIGQVVPSFKQNVRVINKTVNYYETYKDENGSIRFGADGIPCKGWVKQSKGDNWAIRKPLHKDTVFGKVELQGKKAGKGKIFAATRKALNTEFSMDKLDSITDSGIRKILSNYLEVKGKDPELAFSPAGLEELNENLVKYNNGKPHHKIYKVRVYEESIKFQLGHSGNKSRKYVETAKGSNLFFAVYSDAKDTRSYESIPLNLVIERLKQGLNAVPEQNASGHRLKFYLSPNDLVYLPMEDELNDLKHINFDERTSERIKRIYRFTDGSGTSARFIPAQISEVLFNLNKEKQKKVGVEYSIQNEIGVAATGSKNERAFTGEMIKNTCIKIKLDRIGNLALDMFW